MMRKIYIDLYPCQQNFDGTSDEEMDAWTSNWDRMLVAWVTARYPNASINVQQHYQCGMDDTPVWEQDEDGIPQEINIPDITSLVGDLKNPRIEASDEEIAKIVREKIHD